MNFRQEDLLDKFSAETKFRLPGKDEAEQFSLAYKGILRNSLMYDISDQK